MSIPDAEPSIAHVSNNLAANSSTGFDIISWASSLHNLSRYAPSPKDLLLVGPRIGRRVSSYILDLPNAIGGALDGQLRQTTISEATGGAQVVMDAATTAGAGVANIAQAGGELVDGGNVGMASRLSLESARSFGNIFSYSTSRWAVACIVMAIVLNRTMIYASPRRNVRFGWKMRFCLRIVPILLFTIKARDLLMTIQCQTSPDFSILRWNNASKSSEFMFNQDGGFLHTMSSSLLFGQSDEASCVAINMVPTIEENDGPLNLDGSLQQLWPLFRTLCFSQFIETLSCSMQGTPVAAETGMTLFEHSLAFAEAEAAVSSSLGWGPFGEKRSSAAGDNATDVAIKRSMVMKKVNTPPEVLLVGLLSSMNHLTSHVLGMFNLQNRLRLLNTAFWGLCFMATIILSVWTFNIDDLANQALLRFPTVCIIGFIPHILVFLGIIACSFIYTLALFMTALATQYDAQGTPMTFMQRLAYARENMQANVTLSNIQISMRMDFYQALLKTGYNALTMASEAVYLNESSDVIIKPRTWLEESRLKEIEDAGVKWFGPTFRGPQQEMADEVGLVVSSDAGSNSLDSGFARERVTGKKNKTIISDKNRNGIGATDRSGRWIMAFEFFVEITTLVASWNATMALRLLAQMGVTTRPCWLTWFIKKSRRAEESALKKDRPTSQLDFWLLDDNGTLRLPTSDNIDIEAEMRRRLRGDKSRWDHNDEQALEFNLYRWFLNGGWWGSDDSSGQFVPPVMDDDEDNTSVVSATSEVSNLDIWESEEDDGRRTPTQSSPRMSRESTPLSDNPLSSSDLAQLLNPRTPEQRAEAQALAAHLSSDKIVTRSQYKKIIQRDRAKVLTSTRQLPLSLQRNPSKLTDSEEVEILEYLIKSRRAFGSATSGTPGDREGWSEGASGMGDDGPQCVVCQSSPRSIIVWPCRCLSLCDGCRVSLAMNNFDKCVCCRRDVNSFSRIFVP